MRGGHLLLTYNQMWPEVPGDDPSYFRFTRAGIEIMLEYAGFEIVVHEERARIMLQDFPISLGGGVVARKP